MGIVKAVDADALAKCINRGDDAGGVTGERDSPDGHGNPDDHGILGGPDTLCGKTEGDSGDDDCNGCIFFRTLVRCIDSHHGIHNGDRAPHNRLEKSPESR